MSIIRRPKLSVGRIVPMISRGMKLEFDPIYPFQAISLRTVKRGLQSPGLGFGIKVGSRRGSRIAVDMSFKKWHCVRYILGSEELG